MINNYIFPHKHNSIIANNTFGIPNFTFTLLYIFRCALRFDWLAFMVILTRVNFERYTLEKVTGHLSLYTIYIV